MSDGNKGDGNKGASHDNPAEATVNNSGTSPINVKAEVSAKASLELKGTIPEASTGRFVDSLSDIISPLSEGLGLLGDYVRIKRQNLRLQQDAVVLKVINLAIERVVAEGKADSANPVPPKILVPLLENASQENPDDSYMMDRWASLLATAATETTVSPRIVSLLSELNGRQALLLANIAKHRVGFIDFAISQKVGPISAEARKRRPPSLTQLELNEIIEAVGPGLRRVDFSRFDTVAGGWNHTRLFDADSERLSDLHILLSLSLVEFDGPDMPQRQEGSLRIRHTTVAFLGAELLRAVKAQPT